MLKRYSVWTRAVLFSIPLILVAVSATSQSFYGSLVTVVNDAQGGVIPGATVVLVNPATSERREGVSDAEGIYRFVNLVPGSYRLEVELTGFQRYVRDKIEVNVQSTPRIEATMQLGSLSETVLVSGEAPVLQTENASVGIVVESNRIRQLSLNGGNVLNLITLAPSVVPQGGSEGSLTGKNVFAAGNYQIGGGTANQSASYFDGVTVQDSAYGNIVVLTPSPEAVEEFRVQTNNSSAEFGRFVGGVINIASRSGTNTYRGSLFEQHRNKALNSNTYFGKLAGLDKPPFVQNNFGGSLGGPVFKDKLFFFGSYEGYRNREGVLFRRTVPTAAMKNGDFSDYRGTGQTVVPIYDPWTQCGINNPGTGVFNGVCGAPGVPNRQQFPGNIIPSNRISPIAKKFLDFPIYAAPTVAGRWNTNNFERNASIGGDNNQVNVRADYNVSQNNRIIGRYTRFDSTNLPVDVYGNGQTNGDPYSPEHFITTQAMVADTYTFNSSTVLDVRFGVMRWDYDRTPGNLGTNIVSTFGLPVVPYGQISERSDGVPPTLPAINAGSNQVIGTGLIYADDYTYSLTPTLTKIAGDHTLKAGANLLIGEVNYFQNNNVGGTFTFANNPTALDGTNPGATGDPFASFLIGQPTGGTYQSSNFNYGRSKYQAYFVEDSWQMTPRLTLNLGLRMEQPGAYYETQDRLVTFNPDAVNPLLTGRTNPETGRPYVGAFELVASDAQPERTLRKNPLQFAPRVGVAYRITDNTVVRAGGGTFYVPSTARFPDGPTGNSVNNRTNNIATSVDNNRTFFTGLSNPFPTGVDNYPGRDPSFQQVLLGGTGNQFYRDEEGYPGRSEQFNVALQHQFPSQPGGRGRLHRSARQPSPRHAEHESAGAGSRHSRVERHDRVQLDGKRDHSAGAARVYVRAARHVLRGVSAAAGPESVPRVDSRRRAVDADGSAQPPAESISALHIGEPAGIFRRKQLQRVAVAGGQALRRRQPHQRELHVLQELRQRRDGDRLAGIGRRQRGRRLPDQRFGERIRPEQLRCPAQGRLQLRGGTAVRGRQAVRGRDVRARRAAHQRVDAERRHHLQAGLPLAFTATPNLIGSGYGLRPNVDPNCDKKVSGSAVDRLNRWFNTSCFSCAQCGVRRR